MYLIWPHSQGLGPSDSFVIKIRGYSPSVESDRQMAEIYLNDEPKSESCGFRCYSGIVAAEYFWRNEIGLDTCINYGQNRYSILEL